MTGGKLTTHVLDTARGKPAAGVAITHGELMGSGVKLFEACAGVGESDSVTRFAEAGAGKVLSGMAKRIAPDVEATPLNNPADLEAFAASLKG